MVAMIQDPKTAATIQQANNDYPAINYRESTINIEATSTKCKSDEQEQGSLAEFDELGIN